MLNNLFAGAQTAVKNLLAKNLNLDSIVLKSSSLVNNNNHQYPTASQHHGGGRDFIEIALEKIVDKLNFQFYKASSNATYDPIRQHIGYFRLPLNDKMAILIENVYNSTIGAISFLDNRLNQGLLI